MSYNLRKRAPLSHVQGSNKKIKYNELSDNTTANEDTTTDETTTDYATDKATTDGDDDEDTTTDGDDDEAISTDDEATNEKLSSEEAKNSFSLLTETIIDFLSLHMVKNMSPVELKKLVTESLVNAVNNVRDSHESITAENQRELMRLRGLIKAATPTLNKILMSPGDDAKKCEAINLYDVFSHTEPNTEYHNKLIERINKLLNSAQADHTVTTMLEEESRLSVAVPSELLSVKIKIFNLDATDSVKSVLYGMCSLLSQLSNENSDYLTYMSKLRWAIELPYRRAVVTAAVDIKSQGNAMYKKLDGELYGMKSIKERLLQIYVNRLCNPTARSMLALCGQKGHGKTAVAKALAAAAGLPYERIPLGGLEDPSVLTGTDKSWSGATPSVILQILRRMKVNNGVVLFDEIDKIGNSERGRAVQNALLSITDYTQNNEFKDLFLSEFPHDISNIWFMFAMNDVSNVDPILADRLEILHVEKYSAGDISMIIKNHLLPAALTNSGLHASDISITDEACRQLYTNTDEGLRPAQRMINDCVAKINMYNIWRGGIADITKLSFVVPKFDGYPYIITPATIRAIAAEKKGNSLYNMMYI